MQTTEIRINSILVLCAFAAWLGSGYSAEAGRRSPAKLKPTSMSVPKYECS